MGFLKGLVQNTGFLTGASGAVIQIKNHGAMIQVAATTADVVLSRELASTASYQNLDTVLAGTSEKAENLDAGNYKLTSSGVFYYSVTA